MKRNSFRVGIGLVAVVLILLSATAYGVRERTTSIVTRVGKPVRIVEDAGLHWKWPWPIERVNSIDRRRRVLETAHTEMLTRDKKNLILLSYVTWEVSDPLLFFRAVGTIHAGEEKLDGLITSSKIGVMGRYDLSALVSTELDQLKVEEIEEAIVAEAETAARDRYGIEILQVGFKRVSLPEANVSDVFSQMRAERERFASRFRSQGEAEATDVRSRTNYEVRQKIASAESEAARIRGEADAEAASIYAAAHGQSPNFFKFWRQLQSAERILRSGASVILRTDSAPFSLLLGPDGEQEDVED